MQEAGSGDEAAVRIPTGGEAGRAEIGVGAGSGGDRGVSEIAHYGGESRTGGEILRLEIFGSAGCDAIDGAGSGRVLDFGERVADGAGEWPVTA